MFIYTYTCSCYFSFSSLYFCLLKMLTRVTRQRWHYIFFFFIIRINILEWERALQCLKNATTCCCCLHVRAFPPSLFILSRATSLIKNTIAAAAMPVTYIYGYDYRAFFLTYSAFFPPLPDKSIFLKDIILSFFFSHTEDNAWWKRVFLLFLFMRRAATERERMSFLLVIYVI